MSAGQVHIEPKCLDYAKAATSLVAAMQRRNTRVLTPTEASVLSGLPLHLAEPALLQLARRLPCQLEVLDGGQLRFHFAHLRTHRSRAQRALARLRPVVSKFGSPLLGWFAFVLTLVALFCILSSITAFTDGKMTNGQPNSTLHNISLVPGLLVAVVMVLAAFPAFLLVGFVAFAIHGFATVPFPKALLRLALSCLGFAFIGAMYWRLQRWIYLKLSNGRLPATLRGWLLGPPRQRPDPLADERQLTALITARRGVLSAADLVELFGWTLAQADAALVRILVDYGGDLFVTDDGAIIYDFADLADANPPTVEPVTPAFEHDLPREPFFGCSPAFAYTATTLVILGAILALTRPDASAFPTYPDYHAVYLDKHDELHLLFTPGLGLYPYIALAALWATRGLLWARRDLQRTHHRRLRRLITLFHHSPDGAHVHPDAFRSSELVALGADIDVERTHQSGDLWLTFPDLRRGRLAASRHRDRRP